MSLFPVRFVKSFAKPFTAFACALTAAALAQAPAQAEPAACLSMDPAQWPAPSKPYFMLIVDNSGSMTTAVTGAPSCAGYPSTRNGHARCAVQNTIRAYSGEVNFGLATYTERETACTAGTCPGGSAFNTCTHQYATGNDGNCGALTNDPGIGAGNNMHLGGYVIVPMLQDHYWAPPPSPSNVSALQSLVDNACGVGTAGPDGTVVDEIGAQSNTPLAGALFSLSKYFAGTYVDPFGAEAVPTPIGTVAEGERGCRPIQIILITDGDETCDCPNGSPGGNCHSNHAAPAPIAGGCAAAAGAYPNTAGEPLVAYEADKLFHTGIAFGGQTFNIKTNVIGFAGATVSSLNNIANCGGTGTAFSTANETQISEALSSIIAGAIKPETCDNTDNNCNGCTDEGFTHYCDVQPVAANCCAWCTSPGCTASPPVPVAADFTRRAACLTNYTASIATTPPQGNLNLLPCTTVPQAQQPNQWLCFNPGEKCDNVDNNCELNNGNGVVDDGVVKCGSPLHCPQPETCNGLDDDCDGVIDNGGVCGSCTPSAEVCDGCDNNCNGIVDEGIAPIACGPTGPGEPANCQGTMTCKLSGQPVSPVGGCLPGGGFTACNNNPQPEICDGLDNDCNGIIDDVPSVDCVPPGTPPGLVYDTTEPQSVCHKGKTQCINGTTVCQGFIGPSAEVCDGLDNDCNGKIDDAVPGAGLQCGVNQAPCVPGLTACVNGAIVCQGGIMPQPEICDGIDNNCNGQIDDGLTDAPPPGMAGCWDEPLTGGCATPCQYPNPAEPGAPAPLKWCAPPGADCNDLGALTSPCHTGQLTCKGTQGWVCTNDKEPSPEVCDGIDNDCNGKIDDGIVTGVGQSCGINGPVEPDGSMGPCRQGTFICTAGTLSCVGGIGPSPEICDGIDNDCNGLIDDGIPIGAACTPDYDHVAYPGDRSSPPCQPGHFQCDGMGNLVCVGGVGPSPEVCDGIDNDCDGKVDEVGTAPDGIDGSANPNPPPAANIGDACGVEKGECTAGKYGCINGQFACIGGKSPSVEVCDCLDNNCDGQVDNQNPNNDPPLCSPGKDCVKSTFGCQCASPGCGGEFGCPAGQVCQSVTNSNTGALLGKYCVTDPSLECGDCTTKTVTDGTGAVACAPAGTVLANCVEPPVCVCKGQNGCQAPCLNVTCDNNTVCAQTGANAGKCVQPSCFNVPCQGCGTACNLGSCVTTKCNPDPCKPGEECVPILDPMDPTGYTCKKSCADVTCPSGHVCEQGVCKPTCGPACASGKTCDESQTPPTCVDNKCPKNGCSDGSCCNPVTGSCGQNCPCNGVVCPSGQVCQNDSCVEPQGTGGGTSTSASSSSAGGGSATSSGNTSGSTSNSTGQGGGGANDNSVWGLATGGGGCQCEMGDTGASSKGAALALLALAMGMRRKRRRGESLAAAKGVQS